MGCGQGEQPMLSKEGIGPAMASLEVIPQEIKTPFLG